MSIVMRIGRTDRHPVIAEPSNMAEIAYINNRNQRAAGLHSLICRMGALLTCFAIDARGTFAADNAKICL